MQLEGHLTAWALHEKGEMKLTSIWISFLLEYIYMRPKRKWDMPKIKKTKFPFIQYLDSLEKDVLSRKST